MIAIPAGTDTDRLVDGPVLDAITGGIVVNIARASVVDEDALYERLADGRLFAAGLDVWWRVPNGPEEHPTTIPSHRPFHELDNVAMTPHVGGGLGEPGIERARAEAIAGVLAELARDPASTHG
jgi:phosphoglycerate dehydrogenase-like enzyme